MIEFYLYERINPDGTRNNLYDENKNLVPLETPGDLWDLIHIMKEKLQKKTKWEPAHPKNIILKQIY